MLQPIPKTPFPAPESYDRESCGPKPEREALTATGTVSEPVPIIMLVVNFSPIPRIAPPPFGREIAGTGDCDAPICSLSVLRCSTGAHSGDSDSGSPSFLPDQTAQGFSACVSIVSARRELDRMVAL